MAINIFMLRKEVVQMYLSQAIYIIMWRMMQKQLVLAVVDPGHHIEKVMIKGVADYMAKVCQEKKFEVTFIESKVITEPFQFK